MIFGYRLLFLPLLLISLPYYGWRMIRRGGYRHDFHHRFGLIDRPPPKRPGTRRLWIQAVSVGEVKAIGPLMDHLLEDPGVEIILTTTTSTGYQLARELYAHRLLKIGVFPLDFWPFSRSAWRRLEPDASILMEAELWPEHLHQAKLRNTPVILINARISDRSFARYRHLSGIARHLFNQPTQILASSEQDRDRLLALGTLPNRVQVSGNLKFDVSVDPPMSEGERRAMVAALGLGHPERSGGDQQTSPLILLGSSTWPGEEAFLLKTLDAALQRGLPALLLIVPRHAERRGEIRALLSAQSRPFHFRSDGATAPRPVPIYIADTTGELAVLSRVADLAFIGKSLPPHQGGQTPIEAAALGLPIVYGPNMSNFRPICRSLEQAGAAVKTLDTTSAQEIILKLLSDPTTRESMAHSARDWHQQNRGASQRTAAAVRVILTGCSSMSSL